MLKYFLILFFAVSAFADGFKLVSPKLLDLGVVPSDTLVSGRIEFINEGAENIKIEKIHTSCGCTMTELEKMNYQPGESGTVEVQFNTRGFSGITRKSITIFIEGEKFIRHRIILEANVQPLVEFAPLFIDLQDLMLGSKEVKKKFSIKNNMKKIMQVKHIKTDNKYIEIRPDSFSINPGETKDVELFYQLHKSGRDDSFIAIQISEPKKMEKRMPVFVQVAP